jgi:TetR/AcrR family fatty acid metabolism transcriptional regulator
VFSRNGYHSSTVADVAREAKVAAGTIYLYFKRKEELLGALFRRYVGEYLRTSREPLFAEEPGPDQLRRLVELHLAFFATRPELARVFQIHLREINPELREEIGPVAREYFDVVDEVILRGTQAGRFSVGGSPRVARHLVFGSLDATVTAWALSGSDTDLSLIGPSLVHMLTRALVPGDAGAQAV